MFGCEWELVDGRELVISLYQLFHFILQCPQCTPCFQNENPVIYAIICGAVSWVLTKVCFFFFPSPLHPSPQMLMFCLQQQHLNGLNAVPLLEQRHFRLSAVPSEGREVSGDTET